jgi:hypothetical protein
VYEKAGALAIALASASDLLDLDDEDEHDDLDDFDFGPGQPRGPDAG